MNMSAGIVLFILILSSCAPMDRGIVLPAGLDRVVIEQGPLTNLPPSEFEIGVFELVGKQSRRAAPDNVVGYNDHGAHDLKTTKPVPTLVSDAISLGLVVNGHHISEGAPVRIESDITMFWVFATNCRTGSSIKVTLRAIDGKTGALIYEDDYGGVHESIVDCGSISKHMKGAANAVFKYSHEQRTEAINEGLRKLVRQFVYDQNLVDALKASSP
jgi:hypothetical protein